MESSLSSFQSSVHTCGFLVLTSSSFCYRHCSTQIDRRISRASPQRTALPRRLLGQLPHIFVSILFQLPSPPTTFYISFSDKRVSIATIGTLCFRSDKIPGLSVPCSLPLSASSVTVIYSPSDPVVFRSARRKSKVCNRPCPVCECVFAFLSDQLTENACVHHEPPHAL